MAGQWIQLSYDADPKSKLPDHNKCAALFGNHADSSKNHITGGALNKRLAKNKADDAPPTPMFELHLYLENSIPEIALALDRTLNRDQHGNVRRGWWVITVGLTDNPTLTEDVYYDLIKSYLRDHVNKQEYALLWETKKQTSQDEIHDLAAGITPDGMVLRLLNDGTGDFALDPDPKNVPSELAYQHFKKYMEYADEFGNRDPEIRIMKLTFHR